MPYYVGDLKRNPNLENYPYTIDDINSALPIIRSIPSFPYFRVLKVMQDLDHPPYPYSINVDLGAEYPGPKKRLTFQIIVGLYKPRKVKGYLLSY